MYRDLKPLYWWPNMKREITKYMSKCGICQQVKVKHQRPAGLLQPLQILEWKWEMITMDFVLGFNIMGMYIELSIRLMGMPIYKKLISI